MKMLSYDLETSISKGVHDSKAKDPSNDFYTLIYATSPSNVRVLHEKEGFKRTLPEDFRRLLASCDVLVGHNLVFDISYIWHTREFRDFVMGGGIIWDTQFAEYLLTGQRHAFASLAELQRKYLGQKLKIDRISKLYKKAIGADIIVQKGIKCRRIWNEYNKYAELDGSTPILIARKQMIRSEREGMLLIIKAHMRALLSYIMMSNEGIHIDMKNTEITLRDFKIKALEYLEKASECVKHMWDDRLPEFNINSPKHKSAILFGGEFEIKEKEQIGFLKPKPIYTEMATDEYKEVEYYDEENDNNYIKLERVIKRVKLGYRDPEPKYKTITKTITIKGFGLPREWTSESSIEGRYVTDNATVLRILKNTDDPKVKEYLNYQKLAMRYNKMASTYLEPFLRYSIDGKLYPEYNHCKLVTGRLSSNNPNMQNAPASGEFYEAIQGKMVSPEGWSCVDIDFNQLEPYCTALISGDKNLTKDLLEGVCLHCRALSWVPSLSEGKTYDEIYQLAKIEERPEWVLKRKKAKGINFKRAYGGGAAGLAEAENMAIEDVRAVFEGQDLAYPEVKAFNDSLFESLQVNKKIVNELDTPNSLIKTKKWRGGMELLPVFCGGDKPTYFPDMFRHVGVFQSFTGRKYTFEETGRRDIRTGTIRRDFSTTETKNYQIQGTASDVVALTAAELMDFVLLNYDKVRMVRQIHDALSFYVKDEYKNSLIPQLCDIMEDIPKTFKKYLNIDVPFKFKVEAKIGKDFGHMEVWHGN